LFSFSLYSLYRGLSRFGGKGGFMHDLANFCGIHGGLH